MGASAINFLCSYFNVNIFKDNKEYSMSFEQGNLKEPLKEIGASKEKTGTQITCLPDPEMWEGLDDYDINAIHKRMKQLCYLNPDITIKVDITYGDYDIHETYNFPDGVKTYIEDLSKNTETIHDPWTVNKSIPYGNDNLTMDLSVSFVYTESYSDTIIAFTNNVANTDGKSSNITGFKRGLATAMKDCFEETYPKSKLNITAEDTREGVIAVVSIKIDNPNYIGQGKDYLNMPNVASMIYNELKDFCEDQLDKNVNEKENILNRIIASNKVREAAHKAKETARKMKGMSVGKVEKLTKCQSKDPEVSEIFFVEGDSAAGAAKNSRDKNTQAILPVFGKIPNVEELSLAKVLSSEKLRDIINALECGIGEDFDIEKLRYHKIIIMSDADVDGYHIATLYMTFFYRYMRPLIENGYVYLSVPPLYRVETKNQEYYAATDEELQNVINEIGNKKYHITYLKGLGEMSDEGLWQSTMNPENRTLIQVTADDVDAANEMIAMCMNTKVLNTEKREYIMTEEELNLI